MHHANYFHKLAEIYDAHASSNKLCEMRELIKLTSRRFAGRVCIDIGTGTGNFALPFIESGCMVYGVDVEANMIRQAAKKRVIPVVGDARSLPFQANSFELATCRQIFQYMSVHEVQAVVSEAARVLKGNGVFLLHHMTAPDRRSADALKPFMKVDNNPHPYLLHGDMIHIIENSGMTVVSDHVKSYKVTEGLGLFKKYRGISDGEFLKRMKAIRDIREFDVKLIGDEIIYNRYYSFIEAQLG